MQTRIKAVLDGNTEFVIPVTASMGTAGVYDLRHMQVLTAAGQAGHVHVECSATALAPSLLVVQDAACPVVE